MRTLLLFPGALGDVLLLAPSIVALSRTSHVELSVQRAVQPVAAGLAPVGLGPPVDGAAMSALFGTGPVPHALRTWLQDADAIHLWFGRGRPDVAARVAGLTGGQVHSHAVRRGEGPEHVSLAYAADLGLAGPLAPPMLRLPSRARPPVWTVPPVARLVLHPGAGAVAKRWPAERFLALADAWRARSGETTVLCGPAETALVRSWRASAHRVVVDVDLVGVVALLKSAPRYAGNDSGISHLAGALGRIGVVLFGPTRPGRWCPLGGGLHAVPFATTPLEVVGLLEASRRPGSP